MLQSEFSAQLASGLADAHHSSLLTQVQVKPTSRVRVLGKIGEGLTSNVYLVAREELVQPAALTQQQQVSAVENKKHHLLQRLRAQSAVNQDEEMSQVQNNRRSQRLLSNLSAYSSHFEEDSQMNQSFEQEGGEYEINSEMQLEEEEIKESHQQFSAQEQIQQQPHLVNKLYALKVFNKDAKGRQFGLNEESILQKISQTIVGEPSLATSDVNSSNIVRLISTHQATKIHQGGSRHMMRRSNHSSQGINQDPNSLSKALAAPVMDQEIDLDHAPFDCMLFEYCPNSDLFELIKQMSLKEGGSKPFIAGQALTKYIMRQLLTSLVQLHEQAGVAHLDIKLENILIDQNFEVKLCDFGFADEVKTKQYQERGTDGYKAPEVMSRASSGYDAQQADLFALGVTLFTFTFGIPPFFNATTQDSYYREFYQAKDASSVPRFVRVHPATKGIRSLFDSAESHPQQIQFYSELLEIFFALLSPNPQRRPKTAREVLERFSFLQTQLGDLSKEEAKFEVKALFNQYVRPVIQESQQQLLSQLQQ